MNMNTSNADKIRVHLQM